MDNAEYNFKRIKYNFRLYEGAIKSYKSIERKMLRNAGIFLERLFPAPPYIYKNPCLFPVKRLLYPCAYYIIYFDFWKLNLKV